MRSVELIAQPLDSDSHQLAPRPRSQFGEQALDGTFHRALLRFEAPGNLLVGMALEDATQHCLLQSG